MSSTTFGAPAGRTERHAAVGPGESKPPAAECEVRDYAISRLLPGADRVDSGSVLVCGLDGPSMLHRELPGRAGRS
jgi:hypothetical protein